MTRKMTGTTSTVVVMVEKVDKEELGVKFLQGFLLSPWFTIVVFTPNPDKSFFWSLIWKEATIGIIIFNRSLGVPTLKLLIGFLKGVFKRQGIFLSIRAELDQSFMETKWNKQLWEVISTRMRENGYNRSAESGCGTGRLNQKLRGNSSRFTMSCRLYSRRECKVFNVRKVKEAEEPPCRGKSRRRRRKQGSCLLMRKKIWRKTSWIKRDVGGIHETTVADGDAMAGSVGVEGERAAIEGDGVEADNGSGGGEEDNDGEVEGKGRETADEGGS
ncbi:hypothetical protein F3Y22_tig00110832pilonHSYRG00003 [Hibiscus syriacus]|uniref:Uncharacterized protein n=1 Tax=Hibiscus syriacus TaxID=106335 RepID=A0A6A2ZNV1_HIBSY|nr:hypothetical protein F3Y22_tig00110832pilonHSYRG00003 [Hibiscus syriacus]